MAFKSFTGCLKKGNDKENWYKMAVPFHNACTMHALQYVYFPSLIIYIFFITKSYLAVYNGQNYLEMSTVPLEIIKCGCWYMCFAKKIFYLQLSFNLSFQILLNAALWNLAKLCVKFPTLTVFVRVGPLGQQFTSNVLKKKKNLSPFAKLWHYETRWLRGKYMAWHCQQLNWPKSHHFKSSDVLNLPFYTSIAARQEIIALKYCKI